MFVQTFNDKRVDDKVQHKDDDSDGRHHQTCEKNKLMFVLENKSKIFFCVIMTKTECSKCDFLILLKISGAIKIIKPDIKLPILTRTMVTVYL